MSWSRASLPRQNSALQLAAAACHSQRSCESSAKVLRPTASSSARTANALGRGSKDGLNRRFPQEGSASASAFLSSPPLSPSSSSQQMSRASTVAPRAAALLTALAELGEKVQATQEQLGLELAALTGLAAEVDSYVAITQKTPMTSPRTSCPTSARSARTPRSARSCGGSSCYSSDSAIAEAASGRRAAAPVGARHRKVVLVNGSREDAESVLQAVTQMASRCRMALEHTEPLLDSARQAVESREKVGLLLQPQQEAASRHDLQLHKQLRVKLEDNRTICRESAELCLRALRCTSAGCYEPPPVIDMPMPPSQALPDCLEVPIQRTTQVPRAPSQRLPPPLGLQGLRGADAATMETLLDMPVASWDSEAEAALMQGSCWPSIVKEEGEEEAELDDTVWEEAEEDANGQHGADSLPESGYPRTSDGAVAPELQCESGVWEAAQKQGSVESVDLNGADLIANDYVSCYPGASEGVVESFPAFSGAD